ncbi:MAG: CDP-alcohol phosphatidyltransferase family protein [Thermoplasmata archaeon]|nr:CDP-alcohol phosphatidyltransferase family protein [Thermoplasmata archaeon]
MISGSRVLANLATLANALVGVWAVASTLYGNPVWAMLLIVAGLGFDGLDGLLSRRAKLPGSRFGRVADSVADSITFGIAPGVLIAYHSAGAALWASWFPWPVVVGVALVVLAVARLVYFTLYAHDRGYFVGAPTPQTALTIVLTVAFFDVPAIVSQVPAVVLLLAAVAAILMVVPVRFPKIRRGSVLRVPMTVTAIAFVVMVLPLQFRPSAGSLLDDLAVAAAAVAAVGTLAYYLVGPFTAPRGDGGGSTGGGHG